MGMIQSKIIELIGPHKIQIREEDICDSDLDECEIIGKTICTAVSPGTEVAAYRGDPPLRPMKVYPRLVGYCNIGRVLVVGSKVKKVKKGDLVLTFQSHRTNYKCKESDILVVLPENSNEHEFVLLYLFHLGYTALLRAGFIPGHTVAVVGLGTLGVATYFLAEAMAARVYGFSDHCSSLVRNHSLLKWNVFSKNKAMDVFRSESTISGFDIVVSTSNDWADWEIALKLARKGGVVSVLGFPGRNCPIPDKNPLASQYFYDKQLTITSCGYVSDLECEPLDIRFTLKRNLEYLMSLVIAKKLPALVLASKIDNWKNIENVYASYVNRTETLLSTILRWDDE